jgi:hypothetical protein
MDLSRSVEFEQAWFRTKDGGAEGSRTPDLLIANETLYQLSYDPVPPLKQTGICLA